jgi:hypothetical protein
VEDGTQKTTVSPQSSTRPAGLIIMRSGGGRERGAFRQMRVFILTTAGARLLSLSHQHSAGSYKPRLSDLLKEVAA